MFVVWMSSFQVPCHVIEVSRRNSNTHVFQLATKNNPMNSGNTNFDCAFAGSALFPKVLKNPELAGGFGFAVAVAVVPDDAGPVDTPALEGIGFLSPALEDDVDDVPFFAGTEGPADLGILGFDTELRTSPRDTFFEALAVVPFPTSSMVLLTPVLRLLLDSFLTTPEVTAFCLSVLALRTFFASRSLRALSFSRCWKRVIIWLANSRDLSSSDFL